MWVSHPRIDMKEMNDFAERMMWDDVRIGAGMSDTTGGASANLLSSFISKKNPSMLDTRGNIFQQPGGILWVGSRMSVGRGGRKFLTGKINARQLGDGGLGGAHGTKGSHALEAKAVKAVIKDAKHAASNPSLSNTHTIKLSCIMVIYTRYFKTLASIPTSKVDLHKTLLQTNLLIQDKI